jgi:hypothetical protein
VTGVHPGVLPGVLDGVGGLLSPIPSPPQSRGTCFWPLASFRVRIVWIFGDF